MTIPRNWPQGDDLTAAAHRGDLIREILRDHGYSLPGFAIEDILASIAAESLRERRDRSESRPGVTTHFACHREVAREASAAVDQMILEHDHLAPFPGRNRGT